MVELRGLEVVRTPAGSVCNAVVRTGYPDIFEKKELFKGKPVNRGQVRKAISKLYNVPPGDIVWPGHITI